VVFCLQVVQNLLSFADARMSLLLYMALHTLAVLSSFFMMFLSVSAYLLLLCIKYI